MDQNKQRVSLDISKLLKEADYSHQVFTLLC